MEIKKGIFETEFGNAACWWGGELAWDLDSAEIIPGEFVLKNKFIREIKDDEEMFKENILDYENSIF